MKYVLFTTLSCPKCPAFKQFVAENVSFEGIILDDMSDDFAEKISEYGVTAAPIIIILDENDQEVFRTNEIPNLQDFLEKR